MSKKKNREFKKQLKKKYFPGADGLPVINWMKKSTSTPVPQHSKPTVASEAGIVIAKDFKFVTGKDGRRKLLVRH